MMAIHIGTSGWVYPHWRGIFYPEGLPQSEWFGFFAGHFDTVEINNTFYRLPETNTFDDWAEQAPPGFVYAVKANRYLTHMKKLKEAHESLERFLGRVRRLGDALGPILWQLPPHWHANAERLATHAGRLPRDMTHAFEFRDPDWFQASIRRVLEGHTLAFCIYDMVDHDCPEWVTAPSVYLRFHGPAIKYGGRYGREKLAPWADRVKSWESEGREVFAYFNNDLGGFALEDARTLRELAEA
jgi:uncharacterized protein YecE (DUF72 family)